MALTELSVAQPADDADTVAIYAYDGWQSVVAIVQRAHLKQHFKRADLTSRQAALVVRSNIELMGRLMANKYERGEFTLSSQSAAPRVIFFKLNDLRQIGEALTDQVLNYSGIWVTRDGRLVQPAE